MDPIGIVRTGLAANMQRLTASASVIARAGTTGGAASPGSIADALVDQRDASIAAQADLKVIGTVSNLERRTVELWG